MGESGGVEDISLSEFDRRLELLRLLSANVGLMPAVELSEGVGGSPLLQAIEQKMAPRLGRNGRPSREQRQVLQEKQ